MIVAACFACLGFAPSVNAISSYQRESIVQNCPNIKQSITKLQYIDSKTRTYLGTTYETINNRFIIPLNLRLVKNNLPTLSQLQANFALRQVDFRNAYTDYMREVEALLAIDCQIQPDEFYGRLVIVRERREHLRTITVELARLTDEQYSRVFELQENLQ